ncbi:MAG: thermonuclease family protein [Acidimicrobiales bacterium]
MATRPPDWQIGPPRRQHRTLWSDLAGLWRRFRGLPIIVQLIVALLLLLLVINVLSRIFGSDGDTQVASRSTTTGVPTTSTSSTTTIAPGIPAGDDTTAKNVLDGDSFETDTGTKVRLIGIDAPDIETNACFAPEATVHLKDLLPPGRAIRLVYDTTRTDRFGRTLAYVYRLPDGLFINRAMLQDGFAIQVTTGAMAANTQYAREFGDAEADAKAAKRGLWGACATTTTAARASTATTAATTTTPATTTTTAATTTTAVATVVENEICFVPNATGVLSGGRAAVCAQAADGYYRWRAS